jgi:hypothetical protein
MASMVDKTELSALLSSLEVERKIISSTKKKAYFLIGGAVISAIIIFLIGFPVAGFIVALSLAIYGFMVLNKIGSNVAIYKHRFKTEVIGVSLKMLNNTLIIDANSGISPSEFEGTRLFPIQADRYSTEDLISGHIDKTSFYFAEVNAEYKTEVQTKNGTRTEWHDIFKGIIFVADFNKNFNGITIVRAKNISGALGAWFNKNFFSVSDKQVVTLENVDFQRTFITYATDQVEARYILSLALMERILEMNKNCEATVSLSFINSKVYIAFPLKRNCFEPPIFSSILKPDLLNEDINTVNFMCDIVQELDLNTRIWTKK